MSSRGNCNNGYSVNVPVPLTFKNCLIATVVSAVSLVFVFGLTGAVLGPIFSATGSSTNTPARGDPDGEVPVSYSPGDTRIVSFSSFFCSQVTLVDTSNRTGSTLYLIKDTPPLTVRNSFSINSRSFTLNNNVFVYWNYYLYPNSNFTTIYRARSFSDSGTFYLIKGRSNLQQWINNPSTSVAVAFFSIPCTRSLPSIRSRFSFQVQAEGDYYFIYHNNRERRCFGVSSSVFRLDLITLTVSRFQYSTAGLTTAASCSAIAGQCSLNVPSSDYRALIVTDIPNNPDWEEKVNISLHCSSNRAWAYTVVVLIPSLVIIGGIAAAILLGCVCWRKRDSLRACCSRSHSSQPAAAAAPPTSTVVRLQRTEQHHGGTQQQPVAADHRYDKTRPADGDTLNGQQHLTAVPPPSYRASLDYPGLKKSDLPPPYNA